MVDPISPLAGQNPFAWLDQAGRSLAPIGTGLAHFGTVTSAAALSAYAARHLPPLRPIAPLVIKGLSHPAVDAALFWAAPGLLFLRSYQLFFKEAPFLNGGWAQLGLTSHMLTVAMTLGVMSLQMISYMDESIVYQEEKRRWMASGLSRKEARKRALIVADAARRVSRDPEIGLQKVAEGLTAGRMPSDQEWFDLRSTKDGSLFTPLLVGGAGLTAGLTTLSTIVATLHAGNPLDGMKLFLNIVASLVPAMSILLYIAARGDRRLNFGPALSQELLDERQFPALFPETLRRLRHAVPALPPEKAQAVVTRWRETLAKVEATLKKAPLILPAASSSPTIEPSEEWPLLGTRLYHVPKSSDGSPTLGWRIKSWGMDGLRIVYNTGLISPTQVLDCFFHTQKTMSAAVFPRIYSRGLQKTLIRLAEESRQRYKERKARPLEGVLVAVKDLFPGVDGIMQAGSKTARITGVPQSDVVAKLLELGAIPIPVGMVAGALGGSGHHVGHGEVPHPFLEGYDPAGSSSATAYVVGHPDIPVFIGIGTDTGGSVIAPAGACGLFGIVGPRGWISTNNMIPYDASLLDRVGIMAQRGWDALKLARLLAMTGTCDTTELFTPSSKQPRVVVLQKMLQPDFQTKASHRELVTFIKLLKGRGFEVVELDASYDFLVDVPMELYPVDSYLAAAVTAMNPKQRNPLGEPPRRLLDANLRKRFSDAMAVLEAGGGSFFEEARRLSKQYEALVQSLLGDDTVLLCQSVSPLRRGEFSLGRAGSLLDQHDEITMSGNRMRHWTRITFPTGQARDGVPHGVALSGYPSAVLRVLGFTEEVDA